MEPVKSSISGDRDAASNYPSVNQFDNAMASNQFDRLSSYNAYDGKEGIPGQQQQGSHQLVASAGISTNATELEYRDRDGRYFGVNSNANRMNAYQPGDGINAACSSVPDAFNSGDDIRASCEQRNDCGEATAPRPYNYERPSKDFDYGIRSTNSSRPESLHHFELTSNLDGNVKSRPHREKRSKRHGQYSSQYPGGYERFKYEYEMYKQYYQHYQYYENLRKTDPKAYAEMYKRYYCAENPYGYSQGVRGASFCENSSVTSESHFSENQFQSLQRLTPLRFTSPHAKASICGGKLVYVLPQHSSDGCNSTVQIADLSTYLPDDEYYRELKRFPGPLISGTTHKKNVIDYCKEHITNHPQHCDFQSYILLWELLILLVRQNGIITNTDIIEFITEKINSKRFDTPNGAETKTETPSNNVDSTDLDRSKSEILSQYRELLLHSSDTKALEFAVDNGLWGHAMYLATKLDNSLYLNVVLKFLNGIGENDPISTLYQLLSGNIPAIVKSALNVPLSAWLPHISMILSHCSAIELCTESIKQIGEHLQNSGFVYGAQFCDLINQIVFHTNGKYLTDENLLKHGCAYVLSNKDSLQQIIINEIIEYSRGLHHGATLSNATTFQLCTFQMATQLAEIGCYEKAISYLVKLHQLILKDAQQISFGFLSDMITLSCRLKYLDDGLKYVQNSSIQNDVTDHYSPSSLDNLIETLENFKIKIVQIQESVQNVDLICNPALNKEIREMPIPNSNYSTNTILQFENTTGQYPQSLQTPSNYNVQPNSTFNYYNPISPEVHSSSAVEQQLPSLGMANIQNDSTVTSVPQISLPTQKSNKTTLHDKPLSPSNGHHSPVKTEPTSSKKPNKNENNGWFDGIFSKLSLKPKNQMILPDDTNPTIIWDENKKKWVNIAEEQNGANTIGPPPTVNLIAHSPQTLQDEQTSAVVNAQGQPNMYKLAKRRDIKKSYIDVFNNNSDPSASQVLQ